MSNVASCNKSLFCIHHFTLRFFISIIKRTMSESWFISVKCFSNKEAPWKAKRLVGVITKWRPTSSMDHKSLKRSRQELNTPRRPLISTSKSLSVVKLASAFRRDKKTKLPQNSWQTAERLWRSSGGRVRMKVAVNFFLLLFFVFGLVSPPLPLEAACFDPLLFEWHYWNGSEQGGPPAGAALRKFYQVGGGG